MNIPGQIKRDPRFIYLSDYYSPEEAAAIVARGIAINRPGVIPSLQVPGGNKGCQGLGVSLLEAAGDIPAPVLVYDPTAVFKSMPFVIQNATTGTTTLSPGGGSPGAQYPSGIATPKPQSKSDEALDWVEKNWVLVAGGLGILLVMSMTVPRR